VFYQPSNKNRAPVTSSTAATCRISLAIAIALPFLSAHASAGQTRIATSRNVAPATTQHFSIISNFDQAAPNSPYTPYGGVYVDKTGNIFGTTYAGGANADGTVFKLTPSGKTYVRSIVHSYKTKFDGQNPVDHPIEDGSGNLFVTASADGPSSGSGTGIELSTDGNGYHETGLATIPGAIAPFVQVGTTLFVTSPSGGAHSCGAIYEFTGTNGFTPIDVYDFCTTPNDGTNPSSELVADSSGALYGTVSGGGTNGSGAVFKFVPSKKGGTGTLTALYNFYPAPGDGRFPYGSVTLDGKGNIFGTTQYGGSANYGTIFKLTPSNGHYAETILHSFMGTPDAENPTAGLALIGAKLYGTTNEGGTGNFGTIYTVGTAGSNYSIAHNFAGGVGGQYPQYCPLFVSGGALFGTTTAGGAGTDPQGTVFEYVP